MTEQFRSMERDVFHVSYLSDKIPEAVFHGQAVKTVAYLRVSTAHCVFPLSFARQIKIDPLKMKMQRTAGIGNAGNPTYYEKIAMRIIASGTRALTFSAFVGFTEGLKAIGFGLLGQEGVFEKFSVAFNHKERKFLVL